MENKDTINLNQILVKYLRRWKLFLTVFILSFIPAIIYLKLYPETYQFNASILLNDEEDSGISGSGIGGAASLMKSFGIGPSMGSISVDDEMEILASNRLLRKMVLELGVNVVYSKPNSFVKMYREAPLKLSADSAVMANLQDELRFKVSVSPGKIKIIASAYLGGWKETFTCSSLPTTLKIGKDEFTLDFDNDGAGKGSFKMKIKCLPAGWMAENVSNNVLIEDASSASNVLYLSCTDHSRQRGLDMLNTLIAGYNEEVESYKRSEDMKTMKFVDDRISIILTDLAAVEAGIEDFKKKNDMTLLEADVTLYGETFRELQTAIIEAELMAHQIDLLDAYVKNPENRDKSIPSIFSVADGEKGYIAEYNKALVTRDRFLNSSNETNTMYIRFNNQVKLLREGIYKMIENARESASKSLAELKAKENQMLAKMKSVPEKEREYVNFVRDQEVLQTLYVLMLQKKEETILSLGKQTDRARVIDPPYIMKKRVGPRKLYAAIGIMILTLVIPVGYIFAKDLLVAIRKEYKTQTGH